MLCPLPVAADPVPHIVVTPYYAATPTSEVGSTVSVISAEEIARSPTESVAELLRTVPGVTVNQSGGPGGRTLVSIRGTEAQHTLVLIDGVRVNDPSSARDTFDFSLFSKTDIERIEILRGPQSALYGSDAIGGVINIITRKSGGPGRFKASVDGGSYGTGRANVSAGNSFGNFSLYGSATYFATKGFSRVDDRDHGEPDSTEKFAGTIRGAFELARGGRFEFGGDAYHQDSEIDGSSTLDAEGYSSKRDLLSGFSRLVLPSKDRRVTSTLSVFAAETKQLFEEPTRDTDYRGSTFGIEFQRFMKLGKAGSLLAGLRLEEESAYQKYSTAVTSSFDTERTLYAGYLLHQMRLGERLHVSLAGRYDGEIDGAGFLTGRATALYDLPEIEARIRGSVGTGAKRPTAFQLSYNPDLVPETSVGADLGLEWTTHQGRLTFSMTGFWNRIDDMIAYDVTIPPFGSYANIDEARTAGVELAATAILVPGVLTATGTYTYLDAMNLVTGMPLPRRPRNSGSLGLVYMPTPKLETTLTATYVGSRTNDAAGTVKLDPYVRLDWAADYRVDGHLTVYGRVENLLNASYQDPDGYNTPGLSAYAGLRWSN